MSKVCSVCVEEYNTSARSLVLCDCGYECCRACIKSYIFSKRSEPACMNCGVVWTRKYIVNNFERSFIMKEYKNYIEDIIYERELGMLQATQSYVEKEIQMRDLKCKIKKLKEESNAIEDELITKSNIKRKSEKIKTQIADLQEVLYEIETRLEVLRTSLRSLKGSKVVERKDFIRKCPNGDCHGFLSKVLKCDLCGCWACGECREVKGVSQEERESHQCNEDIVKSVKLFEKDTKGCPKCGVLICKIQGCDQMWCVECHTAFSWNTLRVENGNIHNPHYFEYQRKAKNVAERNPMEVRCGRELDHYFVIRLQNNVKSHIYDEHCMNVIHMREVELLRFRVQGRLEDNLDLRIKYMMKEIDKESFKKLLQRRHKERMKKLELRDVLMMYISVITDLMYRLVHGNDTTIDKEMKGLMVYTNELLSDISKTYNCKRYEVCINGRLK